MQTMVSLPRVKAMLGIAATDTSQDTLITDLIHGAVAFIETQTNRYFREPVSTREYHLGHDTGGLYLLSIPYVTTTSDDTTASEQKAPGLTVTSIDRDAADGFELRTSARSAWLRRAGTAKWRSGFEYVVDYTHGWDVDGLPSDIEHLVFMLVARRYKTIEGGDLKSETIGGYSYTRFGVADLVGLDGAEATLDAWREPVLA